MQVTPGGTQSASGGTGRVRCPIYRRTDLPAGAALTGPAIIEDADSTTLLPTGRQLTVTEHGLLLILLLIAEL